MIKESMMAKQILKLGILSGITFCCGGEPLTDTEKSHPFCPRWAWNRSIYQFNFEMQSREGTFRAFIPRLAELKRLGVGILWTQPLHPRGRFRVDHDFLKRHGGAPLPVPEKLRRPHHGRSPYCVRDYFAIDPRYGTAEDFRSLVKEIHRHGMKIIVGFVPNHTSWDHPLTEKHPQWYKHNAKGYVQWVGPWKDIAQLDYSKHEVWQYMERAYRYWIEEFDVDGFRNDVAGRIPLAFWKWLRPRMQKIKPVFMLAEADEAVLHPYQDATYDWTIQPTLWQIIHFGKPASLLDNMLEQERENYHPPFFRMRHLTNHDVHHSGYAWPNRKHFPSEHYDWLKKTPLQTKYGKGFHAAVILTVTLPWSKPMLWNGQEFGMLQNVRGCVPDWPRKPQLEDFYRRFLHLYRICPALTKGDFRRLASSSQGFAFSRKEKEHQVVVFLNLGATTATFNLELGPQGLVDLFTGTPVRAAHGDQLRLSGWEWQVWVDRATWEQLEAELQK
ncbi:MAG: hypothetical protein D6820_08165 [Lentisphaerae bacterium]|nr:MAG: hypothetical protein D6820_08165 [Lentisphaerota bacterium]